MRKIGLTGGIGCGKSTVAAMLVAGGAGLIDADAISRSLALPGGVAMPALRANFGEAVVAPDGSLDREAMRRMMLGDIGARARLEGILHPLIGQSIDHQLTVAQQAGYTAVVIDIPLLVEGGQRWRHRLDAVWVVDCTAQTQVTRVQARSAWPMAQIKAVMAVQASRAQRLAAADAVIANDALSLSELQQQVLALLKNSES